MWRLSMFENANRLPTRIDSHKLESLMKLTVTTTAATAPETAMATVLIITPVIPIMMSTTLALPGLLIVTIPGNVKTTSMATPVPLTVTPTTHESTRTSMMATRVTPITPEVETLATTVVIPTITTN
jgi:hypothetical protein